MRLRVATEQQEAFAFWSWCSVVRWRNRPLSELVLMIPNGLYLGSDARTRAIVMAKAKRAGFRPGIYDYLLPVTIYKNEPGTWSTMYPGLWLELKRRKGSVVRAEQATFANTMGSLGWHTAVCKGAEQATAEIEAYLGLSGDRVTRGFSALHEP